MELLEATSAAATATAAAQQLLPPALLDLPVEDMDDVTLARWREAAQVLLAEGAGADASEHVHTHAGGEFAPEPDETDAALRLIDAMLLQQLQTPVLPPLPQQQQQQQGDLPNQRLAAMHSTQASSGGPLLRGVQSLQAIGSASSQQPSAGAWFLHDMQDPREQQQQQQLLEQRQSCGPQARIASDPAATAALDGQAVGGAGAEDVFDGAPQTAWRPPQIASSCSAKCRRSSSNSRLGRMERQAERRA